MSIENAELHKKLEITQILSQNLAEARTEIESIKVINKNLFSKVFSLEKNLTPPSPLSKELVEAKSRLSEIENALKDCANTYLNPSIDSSQVNY